MEALRARVEGSSLDPNGYRPPLPSRTGFPTLVENDDGTITSQGTIVWTGATRTFFEVTKAGDKKLKCDYWPKGLRGDAVFTKKWVTGTPPRAFLGVRGDICF
jgi:hypothetical protein